MHNFERPLFNFHVHAVHNVKSYRFLVYAIGRKGNKKGTKNCFGRNLAKWSGYMHVLVRVLQSSQPQVV
jgi:hypothetical protein